MLQTMTDAELERFVRSEIEEYLASMPDAVFGMLSPAFVRCSAANLSLTVRIHTSAWMRNANNVCHGGAIAAMLDGMGGLLARSLSKTGWIAPTVCLQVSYLKAVPLDIDVDVTVAATHAGSQIIQLRSELTDPTDEGEGAGEGEDKTLYATGSGTQFVR